MKSFEERYEESGYKIYLCTKDKEQLNSCKNKGNFDICLRCKRFYENGEHRNDLEDLYRRK